MHAFYDNNDFFVCKIVYQQKTESPISIQDHHQKFSPLQISNTGFEPAQNLN